MPSSYSARCAAAAALYSIFFLGRLRRMVRGRGSARRTKVVGRVQAPRYVTAPAHNTRKVMRERRRCTRRPGCGARRPLPTVVPEKAQSMTAVGEAPSESSAAAFPTRPFDVRRPEGCISHLRVANLSQANRHATPLAILAVAVEHEDRRVSVRSLQRVPWFLLVAVVGRVTSPTNAVQRVTVTAPRIVMRCTNS